MLDGVSRFGDSQPPTYANAAATANRTAPIMQRRNRVATMPNDPGMRTAPRWVLAVKMAWLDTFALCG